MEWKGAKKGSPPWSSIICSDDMEERGRVETPPLGSGSRDKVAMTIIFRARLFCFSMNPSPKIIECHAFETAEKRSSDFTGRFNSISSKISGGRSNGAISGGVGMLTFSSGSVLAAVPMARVGLTGSVTLRGNWTRF